MKPLGKAALLFIGIGLLLYAAVYYSAERLLYRTGRSNPFFKLATAEERHFDWVILGASHAMPLAFDGFNAHMEAETGLRILNLAAPGTGPLYTRFVLEHFLRGRRADHVLYVLNSFAFHSRTWNEDRFADASLLRRTPFEPALARHFFYYSRRHGVAALAVLDYVTGFSKLNHRDRFEPDIWEGEKQFERTHRPSAVSDRKRIEYLYPEGPDPKAFRRYLEEFAALVALVGREGMDLVAIKMPVPARFHARLPEEAAFDEAVGRILEEAGAVFHDFSLSMDEPRFYFDTDHLNRTGLTEFFERHLKAVLLSP
jgi:hypothetical protein